MIKVIPHTEVRSFDISYRSEDVRFSPSGRRLALVATEGCLLLFAVDIEARPIRVEAEVEFRSTSFLVPHGVEFISEDVLVVANRNGNLVFFQLPPSSEWVNGYIIEPIHEVLSPLFGQTGVKRKLRERDLFCGPGSVRKHGDVLFVTCNYMNTVSTFDCHFDANGLRIQEGIVIAHAGLSVVDGIALNTDGSLMALSDHDHHRVAIYRRINHASDSQIVKKSQPNFKLSCSLTDIDMHFPHGLRFDKDGKVLYAVDAGGRFIHVFKSTDNWQLDMRHSTFKTFGVDLQAFNKSQEMVSEEYRMLEGGGKGLDIDSSGHVLVVTCRNQSLRFFEIETKDQVKLKEATHQQTQLMSNGSEIALSCLVDDTPSIWRSLIPWLATAIRLANMPPGSIHIHHVCELNSKILQLCRNLGINTHFVARFDVGNVYSNKIIQGETQFGKVNSVILTDVDVVFTGPPPFQDFQGFVAGKTVDMENPPLHVLKKIFIKAGVEISGIISNEYSRNSFHKIFETVMGNFNGGMYIIPSNELVRLSQRWGVWARWLSTKVDLMECWDKHLDQIAFCLAVNELKMPISILNNLWNFPIHLDMPALKTEPWVFHHHAELDEQLCMKPMKDPIAQIAVERVNNTIRCFRQQYEL